MTPARTVGELSIDCRPHRRAAAIAREPHCVWMEASREAWPTRSRFELDLPRSRGSSTSSFQRIRTVNGSSATSMLKTVRRSAGGKPGFRSVRQIIEGLREVVCAFERPFLAARWAALETVTGRKPKNRRWMVKFRSATFSVRPAPVSTSMRTTKSRTGRRSF